MAVLYPTILVAAMIFTRLLTCWLVNVVLPGLPNSDTGLTITVSCAVAEIKNIAQKKKLNSDFNVQVCDATEVDNIGAVGFKRSKINYLDGFKLKTRVGPTGFYLAESGQVAKDAIFVVVGECIVNPVV